MRNKDFVITGTNFTATYFGTFESVKKYVLQESKMNGLIIVRLSGSERILFAACDGKNVTSRYTANSK